MSEARDSVRSIRMVVTDVDGVLTDGGMYYSEHGDELKKFNVRDGMGVALLKAAGIRVGAISGEKNSLIRRRLDKIGVDFCFLGIRDKRSVLTEVQQREGCPSECIAYVGDELNDLPLLSEVGVFFSPADASGYIRARADHVVSSRGGEGVLRDVAEFILQASGLYEEAVERYVRGLLDSKADVSPARPSFIDVR